MHLYERIHAGHCALKTLTSKCVSVGCTASVIMGLLFIDLRTIMASPSWLSSRPARILRWPSRFVPKVSFAPTAGGGAR